LKHLRSSIAVSERPSTSSGVVTTHCQVEMVGTDVLSKGDIPNFARLINKSTLHDIVWYRGIVFSILIINSLEGQITSLGTFVLREFIKERHRKGVIVNQCFANLIVRTFGKFCLDLVRDVLSALSQSILNVRVVKIDLGRRRSSHRMGSDLCLDIGKT